MQGVDERSVGDVRRRGRARAGRARHGLAALVLAVVALSAAGAASGGSQPISVSVSGTQGDGGWYVSDAFIDWTVNLPYTATSGCVDETVGETTGYTSSCTAEDGLGGSASDSVTVKVDKTAPSIDSHGDVNDTTTNAGGKNVSFSNPGASDGTSGVQSVTCTPASGSHFDVGETTVSCRATDNAGNQSGQSTFKVILTFQDTTPPVIGHSISGTAGDAGWYTSDVTVTWTVTDPESTPTSCPPDTLTASGSATCNASSAGGPASSTVNVKIDKTPPSLVVPSVVNDSTTDPAGKNVTFTVTSDGAVTCTPASGSHFPIGTTPVSCTARDPAGNTAGPAGFNVNLTKIDTTPPVVTPTVSGTLGNAGWYRSNVSITFAVSDPDGPITSQSAACAGASLVADTAGTTVTCTATSQGGTTNSPVTVKIDKTPPTLSVPSAGVSATTPVPSGAAVTYAATSNGTLTCAPGSGSTFPVGTTAVSCSAVDQAGNTAGPATFNVVVTLVDTTAPVLSAHANETREATSTTGTAVTYALPGATDNLDTTPTVTCAPGSGSVFPLGSTVVTCTARDDFNNVGTGTFSVIVADTTPPLVNVPTAKKLEANGPSGSTSNYAGEIGGSDLGEPLSPGQISCAPASGSTFSLGTTTVTCTATDPRGNKGTGAFTITVSDNTPPVLHAPSEASFFADAPSGIPTSHSAVQRFLGSPVAEDIVDESVLITNNAPAVFPMGETTVTFRAVDDSGNAATQIARVTVKPRPADQPTGQPALPAVDIIPPQNPRGVGANSTPGSITISWQAVSDAEQYEVYRSASNRSLQSPAETPTGTLVYRGKATRFRDSKVADGVEYRYVIVAVDKAGNRSVGEVVVAVGKRLLLLRPSRGAKSSKPPVLVLAPVAGATYYNIQLFRGTQKILSVWPSGPRLALPLTWRYGGRAYRLSPGVYRWYAWPGLGKREDARYGAVMGESTFTIVPAKKATKKKATKKKATKKKATTSKKASSSKSKTSKKRKR